MCVMPPSPFGVGATPRLPAGHAGEPLHALHPSHALRPRPSPVQAGEYLASNMLLGARLSLSLERQKGEAEAARVIWTSRPCNRLGEDRSAQRLQPTAMHARTHTCKRQPSGCAVAFLGSAGGGRGPSFLPSKGLSPRSRCSGQPRGVETSPRCPSEGLSQLELLLSEEPGHKPAWRRSSYLPRGPPGCPLPPPVSLPSPPSLLLATHHPLPEEQPLGRVGAHFQLDDLRRLGKTARNVEAPIRKNRFPPPRSCL